jgi:hypothetical protein
MNICTLSGKNAYETEDDAIRASQWSRTLQESDIFDVKPPLRVYNCNWCYKWHLTSKAKPKVKG